MAYTRDKALDTHKDYKENITNWPELGLKEQYIDCLNLAYKLKQIRYHQNATNLERNDFKQKIN